MPNRKVDRDLWLQARLKPNGDCLEYQGNLDKDGYGRFTILEDGVKRSVRAHRYAYYSANGSHVNRTELIMHSCDNPPCCNPEHLYIGTHLENMKDKLAKGRHRCNTTRGTERRNAKLTAEQVREIRSSGLSTRKLAEIYGISSSNAALVKSGGSYKNVS